MKKRVAIIGVTGAVGQEFVQSLKNHPWFEVTQIAASERSAGKKYVDAIRDDSGIVAFFSLLVFWFLDSFLNWRWTSWFLS